MTWATYLTGAMTVFLVVVAVVKPWRYPKNVDPTTTTSGDVLREMAQTSGDWWIACVGFSAGWFVTVPIALLAGAFVLFVVGTLKLLTHYSRRVNYSTGKKERNGND